MGESAGGRQLRAYMQEFLETRVRPYVQDSTWRSYLEALNPNFYNEGISEVYAEECSSAIFERYYLDLLSRKSRSTTEVIVMLTKRLSTYIYSLGIFPDDYAARIILPKRTRQEMDLEKVKLKQERKRYFSKEDVRKFFRSYENGSSKLTETEMAWLPVILLQLETFTRAGEVLSIFLDSIDFRNRAVWVCNSVGKRLQENGERYYERYLKIPKNGEVRIVPLSPFAVELIDKTQNCSSDGTNPRGLLFPFRGRMRTVETYEKNFTSICDKLRIDRGTGRTDCLGKNYGLNTHALRHTAITWANSVKGANAINTAQISGHSIRYATGLDLGSDAVYTHAVLSELRKVRTPSMILGFGPKDGTDGTNGGWNNRWGKEPEVSPELLERIAEMEEEGMSSEEILNAIKAAGR